MALGIKRNELSFEILPSSNTKILIFLDTSEYMDAHPERPLLEVTPPGHSRYFLVNIIAKKVNVLNSGLIGFNDSLSTNELVPLADGVWVFKYKVCPYDKAYVQQCHLRITSLECTMRKIYAFIDEADCDIKEDESLKKEINDIWLLLEFGKGAAEECQTKRASTLYQKASKKVTALLNKLEGKCV